MKFLLTRRWILFAITVALLAYGAVWLGEWQFHRLDERVVRNEIIRHNLAGTPVPVGNVLAPDRPVSEQHEWKQVAATGEYIEDDTVIVRYQTRDGASGVDVVTPLLTGSGTALLVDRGWVETGNVGTTRPDVPPAPEGEVSVIGWARADAEGDSAQVDDHSTRAISSSEIGATLPYPVYGGFVEMESETPPAAQPLAKAEKPDLSNGPHFFYGLQWWFFGALALFGFCYLAWDERRTARKSSARVTASAGLQGPHQPPVDREHGSRHVGRRG